MASYGIIDSKSGYSVKNKMQQRNLKQCVLRQVEFLVGKASEAKMFLVPTIFFLLAMAKLANPTQ